MRLPKDKEIMSKPIDVFVGLAIRTMSPTDLRNIVEPSNFEEQYAFHRVYLRLLELAKTEKERTLMETRYPLVKIGGRWTFSIPAMWMYLQAARKTMAATGDERMMLVHDAVQNMQAYMTEASRIWSSLKPTQFSDYGEYQRQLTAAHENMIARQRTIFDAIGRVNRG